MRSCFSLFWEIVFQLEFPTIGSIYCKIYSVSFFIEIKLTYIIIWVWGIQYNGSTLCSGFPCYLKVDHSYETFSKLRRCKASPQLPFFIIIQILFGFQLAKKGTSIGPSQKWSHAKQTFKKQGLPVYCKMIITISLVNIYSHIVISLLSCDENL